MKKVVEPPGHEVFNNGNCIAMPFAKGWGGGYPKERAVPEQRNARILNEVKKVTHNDLCYILENLDRDLVKGALAGEKFQELFFANCKDEKIAECVKKIIG